MLKISRGETKLASKMRCCVPFCKNTSDNVSTSEAEGKGISFHGFPSEVHLRAAWLRALGKQDSHLPDSAVVCSQHFLNDDIYETESGRQIVTGAIPSTVQVCMICLDTDSKMFLMSKHRLEEAYEKLTGHPLCDPGNLKQTVCVQCAQRLINFSRFRDKSLRARALMMDLVEKHELITRRHIKMINRTKHELKSNMVLTTSQWSSSRPDHCDLHILEHSSEDKKPGLEETGHRVVVKTEGSDDSMSVDEDMGVINEDDNNIDDFVQDLLKHESVSFQCTLCLEEFIHEHAYMQHMCMHLQDGDGDGECDTSQVCKPHTAVSSSSSHSSIITENKQPDPSSEAHAAHSSVALLPASLATNNELQVLPTEEADTTDSCRYKNLTDCFVKLYDVFTKKVVPRQDRSLMKTKNTAEEYTEEVANCSSSSRGKVIGSKTLIKSKTDCWDKVIDVQCNDSSQNSSHAVENSFTCDFCGNMYKRKSLLIKHIKTHTVVKRLTCKIWQYKINQKNNLSRHMRTHSGIKPFSCKLCDYESTQKGNLTTHMRTHTGEKPYTCKICNSKFGHNSHLTSHMRTHTGEKPFACKLCNYKFAQSSNLVTHMRTHTGEKPFACKMCNYKCAQTNTLVKHMRIHTGEKPFACKLCNYKFAQSSNLVTHMRTHTGEKPFACKMCNYKCAQTNTLVKHMRTHTGEKPYTCKTCNNKFTSNSELVSHMRTHTGEKPYICKICHYKFAQNSHLMRHMRTHTGEKPFACKMCNYKCAQNNTLVRHMRTHW